MSYTVKEIAKISGVSPRTLRFYDEIGLLKPAFYGDNNYRYYEEEQLLLLQQILFFRELDFSLSDIQGFMKTPGFDKVETLRSHKNTLQERLEKIAKLIKTIDKTVSHLKGEIKMQSIEIYEGFNAKIENAIEEFSVEHKKKLLEGGIMSQQDIAIMKAAEEKLKVDGIKDFAKHLTEGEDILKAFVVAIEHKLEPNSLEVQTLVEKHYNWTTRMSGVISKNGYYHSSITPSACPPNLPDYYKGFHPNLMDYLFSAMKIFSERA